MVRPGLITEHIMESNKQNQKQYFYYYIQTNELRQVKLKAFKKGEYPIIANEKGLIKLVGLNGTSKKKLHYLLHEIDRFKTEGLGNDIIDTFTLVKDVISIVAKMKRGAEQVGKLCDMNLLLNVISLLLKFQSCLHKGLNMTDFIISLIDLYLLVTSVKDRFKPEMMEELCLASLSMLLPKQLFEIIKRINVFSSAKIVDDVSGIHKLFSMAVDGLTYILNLFPESKIITYLKECLKTLCNFGIHSQLYSMNKIITEEKIGEKIIRTSYRLKIKDFYNSLDHGEFKQWGRKSASVASSYLDFIKLYKRVRSYEECARQEPVGIVFQGPPGCGKSRAMNAVVQSLPWSKYVHQVKDTNDGKDFYDMYENETIFYMDDVGQQGISQWRTFINMISEVKYPLDCARAENKDTKFFNSDIVMATTNEFINLNGLIRTDCIRELPALWRRCFVLDFERIKFTGSYTGRVVWKYYNLERKEFLVGFPSHILKQFSKPISPVFECNENDLDFYAWICSVVVELRKINESRLVNNQLTNSQLDYIRERSGFDAEGLFDWPFSSSIFDKFDKFDDNGADDIDVRLRHLKDELEDSEFLGVIDERRKNKVAYFQQVVCDMMKWMVDRIKTCVESILASENLIEMMAYLLTVVLCYGVMYVVSKHVKPKEKFMVENSYEKLFVREGLNTFHSSLVNNLKEIVVLSSNGDKIHVIGLFSGHCVLVPSHSIITKENNFLTVYNSKKENHIIYDKLPVHVVYLNREEDVAILKLPKNVPTLFRKIAKSFKEEESKMFLLSPFGRIDSCTPYNISKFDPIVYKIPLLGPNAKNVISGSHYTYPVRGVGLCGAVVVGHGSIRGMHVAGNESKGVGVAIRWSKATLDNIQAIFECDSEILPFDMSTKVIPDSSVIKLNKSLNVSVGSKSNFGTTPLYGIFPVTRFPAELTKYGKCTVKDIAKKSFGLTTVVSLNELEFGKNVIRSFLRDSKFRILKEEEVVQGNILLAGLNKKSSNGFKCKSFKEDYINFEDGVFKDDFRLEISKLEDGVINGVIDWEKFVWTEALKDELRNEEKDGVPRSFRVGTIHHQVLMKKWFGWLVEHVMQNRKFNNVMVGINPFVEWPEMYDNLRSCKGVFAGDIAKWDGSMNNMVQDAIKAVLLEFIPKSDSLIPEFLLDQAIRSLVAVQDDLYVTTHSMPSGHYLTAILNSLVNRFYTAMWYEREVGDGNVNRFVHDITDYVYGDDKLVGVRSNEDKLNAISMERFFKSMNMGFTDSLKGEITQEFQSLSEVTFLKRFFRYHEQLKRMVCPLELRTLQSGLSFYDMSKDLGVVMKAKIETYQREAYLWPDRDFLLEDFSTKLKERELGNYILPYSYLYSVYVDPEQVLLELNWGGAQYI